MYRNLNALLKSPEKKLHQLIINRLDGNLISSKSYQQKIPRLVKKGIGGFIIFGGSRDGTEDFINHIQSLSEIPLFIASDIERGVGQQIKNTTLFPCQMAVAASIHRDRPDEVRLLQSAIKAIAEEAIDIGINMPLIPVLDVNQNPDNPIICTRAFSDNPEEVAWFGSQYIKVLEKSGLISCGKHFPGHGDTSIDSHISLPVITKAREDLFREDIKPFIDAIKAGIRGIMVGHLLIPSVDSKPASLSRKIITDILRRELGFDGLVLTDALSMSALKGTKHVPVECINAGADILLHPVDADRTVKALLSAYKKDTLMRGRVEESLHRILRVKEELKTIKSVKVNYEKQKLYSHRLTENSITLVKDTEGVLPLSWFKSVHLVFAGDKKLCESSPLRNHFGNISLIRTTKHIGGTMALFVIFTSIAAAKGSPDIDEGERNRIIKLMKEAKQTVVISFGNPYVLRHFREADVLIAAYETTEQAQKAILKCLRGNSAFKGNLPVTIE